MFTRLVSLLLAAVLLCSCATPALQPAEVPAARLGLRLSPASLGERVELQQHLTIERHGKTDELDAALEVDPTHLELVGLAFGQRVVSLHYDGTKLTTWRHVMLPQQVKAEDILEDLQLTLWPIEAIRSALPTGWRVEDQGLDRNLYLGDELVCSIHYAGMPRWSGVVHLVNRRYQYSITIQSVGNPD